MPNVHSCPGLSFGSLANIWTASADRRPVDPPPVVELRIFEGEHDAKTDVTFSHNANFFLFTTLENARPIAKGRMPVTTPTFPVLTGSPVAGMAYLDRPTPAGYFIFPDLSVRHEGLYRLSFSLFEELKENKDADAEPPEGSSQSQDKLLTSNPMAPQAHVHFRLEVKSEAFAVFSAKKFPGLAESTPLSRTVAEQGCRVRIRRDVRMRRRDKPSDGYPGEYSDDTYARSDRFATPQQPPERPRSISNGSMDAHTPYSTGRRSSMQDYFQHPGNYTPASYQQPPPPPPPAPVQSANSYGPHLGFGGSVSTPTFPPPQMQQQQPTHSLGQNGTSFHYPPAIHSRQMSAPQNFGFHQPQQPMASYANHMSFTQPQTYSENPDYRPIMDHRRASATVLNHQPQQPSIPSSMNNYVQNHPVLQPSYCVSQPQSSTRTTTPINSSGQGPPQLPPLRTDNFPRHGTIEPKYEIKSPSNGMSKSIVPSPAYANGYYDLYTSDAHSANSMPPTISNTAGGRNSKRDFGDAFDNSHMNRPIHNGMRPGSAEQGRERAMIETDHGGIEDVYDDMENFRSNRLVYKRADGSQQSKKCPSPIDAYG